MKTYFGGVVVCVIAVALLCMAFPPHTFFKEKDIPLAVEIKEQTDARNGKKSYAKNKLLSRALEEIKQSSKLGYYRTTVMCSEYSFATVSQVVEVLLKKGYDVVPIYNGTFFVVSWENI